MGVNVNWVPRHAEMTIKMDNRCHIACDTLRNPHCMLKSYHCQVQSLKQPSIAVKVTLSSFWVKTFSSRTKNNKQTTYITNKLETKYQIPFIKNTLMNISILETEFNKFHSRYRIFWYLEFHYFYSFKLQWWNPIT